MSRARAGAGTYATRARVFIACSWRVRRQGYVLHLIALGAGNAPSMAESGSAWFDVCRAGSNDVKSSGWGRDICHAGPGVYCMLMARATPGLRPSPYRSRCRQQPQPRLQGDGAVSAESMLLWCSTRRLPAFLGRRSRICTQTVASAATSSLSRLQGAAVRVASASASRSRGYRAAGQCRRSRCYSGVPRVAGLHFSGGGVVYVPGGQPRPSTSSLSRLQGAAARVASASASPSRGYRVTG